MKRHILFLKNVSLANALLATGKCENEGNWILTCDDNIEDIQILQRAATEFLKGTNYKDYELCFAKPCNYSDFITASKMNKYKYELKSMGASSDRYGNCKVCGKHATEMFRQVEQMRIEAEDCVEGDNPEDSWTHYNCHDLFGHEECLKSKQR